MPDPEPITMSQWADIQDWLLYTGIYLVFIVTFAFSMLTAYAIIPSLVATGHLPAQILKLRSPVVGFAALALIVACSFMGLAIVEYESLNDFWRNWWI